MQGLEPAAEDLTPLGRQLLAERYARDEWFWLRKQCKTFDPHAPPNARVRPFPTDKEYIWRSLQAMRSYPFLVEYKSRQMVKSWLYAADIMHAAQFNPFTHAFLSSEDEDKSYALLERHHFMWSQQADWLKERFPVKLVGNQLQFFHRIGTGPDVEPMKTSVIEALPAGERSAASLVGSVVWKDEAAHAVDAEAFVKAAIPMSVGKQGEQVRLRVLSTPKGGTYFERLVKGAKERAVANEQLMPGLQVWTPKFRAGEIPDDATEDDLASIWAVLECHHSADAELRTKVLQARALYLADGDLATYQQEYELDFNAFRGGLAYPTLSKTLHGIPPFQPPDWWPKIRVIDTGWENPAACVWIAVSPPGWRECKYIDGTPLSVLVVYREFYARHMEPDRLARAILELSAGEEYRNTYIDPSADIHKGNEQLGLSTLEQLQRFGLKPLTKANNEIMSGLGQVRRRLQVHGGSPAMLIGTDCVHTWREMTNYRMREQTAVQKLTQNFNEEPIAKDNHTCDCVRYGAQAVPLPVRAARQYMPPGSFGHLMRMEMAKSKARRRLTRVVTAGGWR